MHARGWGIGRRAGFGVAAILAIGAIALPAAAARNLYVTHEGGPPACEGGILAMSIGVDGTLSNGPAITTVTGTAGYQGVAMTPSGGHLFPAAWCASKLTGMTVNPDGSLTGDGNSLQNQIFTPWGVSAAPNGRFVYVANGEPANVSAFDVSSGIPSFIGAYPAGSQPRGVATTPDGSHVYVGNRNTNNISSYGVGPTGALTHIADIPLPAGPPAAAGPNGIVISPDGARLYSANEVSGNVSGFNVDPSGLLTPIGTFPSTVGGLDTLALSPDGLHLFASQAAEGFVVSFNVNAGGSLSQVGAAVSTGSAANTYTGIAVTPDGRYLYATAVGALLAGKVAAFAIQPSGALVGVLGSPFSTGLKRPDYQSLAIVPDQSPVPSFTAAPAKKGTKVSFDGSASGDPDGAVARYDWDFGDGQTLVDGGATPSHSYATPGRYTVTLTVVDNEGCSTRLVYTGQTASCSGSGPATRSIQAGKLAVTLGGAKKQALSKRGIKLRVKCNVDSCRVKASATFKGLKPRTKAASLRIPKAGKAKTLRLALSRHAYEQLKAALAGGGGLVAKVRATAKAGGLSASARRSVKLTG
jgi:6-phosphogluconolactonase (cycloisomerase 2 family)